ncbi:uncharacterized protein F5891DRAFT_981118 [Suillus fuscotomentosus]|uniref:Uncharacterized protein n=1 Tax=Suillus fuscotomentosus TaxID=1912939 RepID=A0AAD4E6I4_9AGAM|nr:uncharacterized protein F5891DRAFT_981118 [Suillus fuscotomentosus]KAG1899344.1 hypothetical protein F5891DRAFT_981118 [Suillus fuscotomentosus]
MSVFAPAHYGLLILLLLEQQHINSNITSKAAWDNTWCTSGNINGQPEIPIAFKMTFEDIKLSISLMERGLVAGADLSEIFVGDPAKVKELERCLTCPRLESGVNGKTSLSVSETVIFAVTAVTDTKYLIPCMMRESLVESFGMERLGNWEGSNLVYKSVEEVANMNLCTKWHLGGGRKYAAELALDNEFLSGK